MTHRAAEARPGGATPIEPSDEPIFIGGLDRCGKTTMRAFLTSHPRISIPAVGSNMETYFYRRFGDLSDPGNAERCLRAMLRYKHVRYLRPDPERIRREFVQGPRTYERLFSLFLIHHAERDGKPRWGAQTGLIERYADSVFEAFPRARFVHMLRDPRDRYEASLAAWPGGRGRAGGATARWRTTVRLAERNRRRYPDRYVIVRFEDLVRDTERVIREVCEFLGEAFVPSMLAMPGAPEHRDKLDHDDEGVRDAVPLSDVYLGAYRGRVAPRELAFIQLHAGRSMRRHGYETERLGLSGAERVRFALTDWPDQAARMVAWWAIEDAHDRFPRRFGREPDARMIVAEPAEAVR